MKRITITSPAIFPNLILLIIQALHYNWSSFFSIILNQLYGNTIQITELLNMNWHKVRKTAHFINKETTRASNLLNTTVNQLRWNQKLYFSTISFKWNIKLLSGYFSRATHTHTHTQILIMTKWDTCLLKSVCLFPRCTYPNLLKHNIFAIPLAKILNRC